MNEITDDDFENISPTKIEDIPTNVIDAALLAIKEAQIDRDEKKAIATEAHWVLEAAKAEFIGLMKRAGKKKWSVAGHGGYSMYDEFKFKVPSGQENKEKFFDFLESNTAVNLLKEDPRDIKLNYTTVHSQTMNSLCKKLKQIAAEDGIDLEIPGVAAPEAETKIRKTK